MFSLFSVRSHLSTFTVDLVRVWYKILVSTHFAVLSHSDDSCAQDDVGGGNLRRFIAAHLSVCVGLRIYSLRW